ncbi:F-box protein At2g26850-like [Dendrobium catenatum]|uniref:F-box protein n=1 Tax=Dendrobium catenatum TaxID=906689 RepID=A0A2I0WE03_9ASPA|nr:F-box protein At2g26850-like [Dendrobium catenatum]PKU73894.1 F-box protein [Dendrobium catenatum]
MSLFLKPFLPFLLLFIRPLPHKPVFPSWVYELALLAVLLCREAMHHSFEWVKNWSISRTVNFNFPPAMPFRDCGSLQGEVGGEVAESALATMTMLDLPELTIECILEKLSPAELCKMSGVCSYLRERCTSDHLWKRHMKEKWSRVVGEEAWRKWEMQVALRRDFDVGEETGGVRSKGWMGWLGCLWPLSWLKRKMEDGRKPWRILPVDSLISFYQALESGRFYFPAQVYNRENGNAGFLLSCYDAEISYNSRTNKFYARYPPHGKRVPAIEEVTWERVRAPIGTSAHDLHISDCLTELNPGDHIEIQWRRNKKFPFGWWYGVVGHLEVCDRDEHRCCCHASDTIVLEFNHYAPGSRWRRKIINRKEYREDGNEDGFYGGIRKVQKKEEISVWKQFCPAEVQD